MHSLFLQCLVVLSLVLGTSATALPSSLACAALLREAAPLALNPDATRGPREVIRYGKFARAGDFASLPEGQYLYLVSRDGTVVWSPVVPFLDANPDNSAVSFFVSHRSLAAFLRRRTGTLDVVAAGEFELVRIDVRIFVQRVSNRSLTFLPGRNALDVGIAALKDLGLAVDERTVVVDYSPPHNVFIGDVTNLETALALLRFHRSPEVGELRRFVTVLREHFGLPGTHGVLDVKRMRESLAAATRRAAAGRDNDPECARAAWLAMNTFHHLGSAGPTLVFARLHQRQVAVPRLISCLSSVGFPPAP